jgi:hypothetical protein
MSPPTNGATSFAFTPMTAASLPDALLFPFDGFSADDFFNAAPLPPPPPPPPSGAGPNRLLLLPSSSYNNVDVHGNCSAGFGPDALAIAAPTSTVATSGSSSSAPRSPSPSLPLMPSVGERTSRYRGVTRYYLRRCLASDKRT